MVSVVPNTVYIAYILYIMYKIHSTCLTNTAGHSIRVNITQYYTMTLK